MSLPLKTNILIVGNRSVGFETFKCQLTNSQCNVYTASDETQLSSMLVTYEFVLIFIHISPEKEEAIALVGKIREVEKARVTPVIFISEEPLNHESILKCYATGAVDFLLLPVEDEIIDSKVETFADLFRFRLSTETKAVERLRTSEGKYKSLFDTSRDGIVFMSLEGNIENANKAYCDMLGYELEELIFTTGRHHTPEEWWERDAGIRETQVLKRDYSDEYKKEYIKKDKTVFPVIVRICLVRDKDGQPLRLLKVVRDITEEKTLEQRLRQSHKMESVGTLAGGIAHDFNNILGAIIGYAQLAKYNVSQDNPASEDIENIIAASGRAKDLVTHILGFSRASERVMQPVQLHYQVNEVLKLIRASFPSTIEIIRNVAVEGTTIVADSTEMHQVVMNLCTNALHAMEDCGGCLLINLDPYELTAADENDFPGLKPGGYVKLSVCDNGCGIEDEIVEKIFNPYFTTKQKGTGTGLGLSVVQGIIKNHGGWIDVKSRIGIGTEVTVLFPRLNAAPVKKEKEFVHLLRGDEKILFVDDEPSLVYIEKIMLQKLGYHVTSADSGLEAFEFFLKQKDFFDIVITDMTMPGMTGLELAVKISETRANLPVILCTGYNNKITKESARENSVANVLLKPVEIRDLATAIRDCLD